MADLTMDKLVALCKNRGLIFAGSELYGGLANTWDYGPLGVEFKNNVKKAWWQKFVQESKYNVGLDCAILMNREVWVASGHVGGFNDPLMDCKACKARYRADKLIEDFTGGAETGDGWTNAELEKYIAEHDIVCPKCGKKDFTGIRQFNLMFKTHAGVMETPENEIYLRPETAQGIFVNFANVMRSMRKKLPAGIAQIGKSFRNEITPGNFIFRVREFEQMELEFFCKPGEDLQWFDYWRSFCKQWLLSLGIKEDSLRLRDHEPEKLAFYSKATTDFEFLFPFGWGELWGIADRTDYDLTQHQNHSGKSLEYLDPVTNERYIPYCIEPSLGVDRMVLAFLCNAYEEQELEGGDVRTVLHLHPALAPYKAAVLPLQLPAPDSLLRRAGRLLAVAPARCVLAGVLMLAGIGGMILLFPVSVFWAVLFGFWLPGLAAMQTLFPVLRQEYGVEARSIPRPAAPDKPLTAQEQKKRSRANWWYYNWGIVAVAAMVIVGVAYVAHGLLTTVDPDYTVAVVTAEALPDEAVQRLQTALADYAEDANGDGTVVVQVNNYTWSADAALTDMNGQMAGATQMNTDLANGESKIWILDDPEGFEQAYGALSEKLGAEWQTKLIPWRSQPALSGLELGSYNTAADGSQTVDIQSRFAGYSVAVFDASDALWQALNS